MITRVILPPLQVVLIRVITVLKPKSLPVAWGDPRLTVSGVTVTVSLRLLVAPSSLVDQVATVVMADLERAARPIAPCFAKGAPPRWPGGPGSTPSLLHPAGWAPASLGHATPS
jgi:hypothetical protein